LVKEKVELYIYIQMSKKFAQQQQIHY